MRITLLAVVFILGTNWIHSEFKNVRSSKETTIIIGYTLSRDMVGLETSDNLIISNIFDLRVNPIKKAITYLLYS